MHTHRLSPHILAHAFCASYVAIYDSNTYRDLNTIAVFQRCAWFKIDWLMTEMVDWLIDWLMYLLVDLLVDLLAG